jgi:DNA-binding protein YbaB
VKSHTLVLDLGSESVFEDYIFNLVPLLLKCTGMHRTSFGDNRDRGRMWRLVLTLSIISVALSFKRLPLVAPKRAVTSRNLFGNPEPSKDNAPAKKDGGMFGGMGNLMDSMKKAQEIAKQAEVVNKELQDTVIMGQDPSGSVFATFNGLGVPVGLKIADSIMDQGAEAVSLASTQAMVDAHKKSQEAMMTKMSALYSGAGVPMPPQ